MGQQSPVRDLGPCVLVYNGTDLGETRGGVKFRYEEEDVDIMEDKFGSQPVDSITKGSKVEVECQLTRLSLAQLSAVLAASSGSGTSIASGKMVVKTKVGYSRYDNAYTLILKPITENGAATADTTEWLYVYKAAPIAQTELDYDMDNQRIFQVMFKGFPFQSPPSGAQNRLWGIGTDGT